MNNLSIKFIAALIVLTFGVSGAAAQKGVPAVNPAAELAGLNLYAAAEVFRDSENLEKFEQNLNSPENGINNLDLDEDDTIDFIRVTEQVADDTHLIILQTPLGETEFQDIATIAVEKETGENYNLHIQGDETIYGENYYVVPAENNFSGWKIARWLFRPNYRAYVSPFDFKNRPRWWGVRRPLAASVYRARVNSFADRRNFSASRTVRVKSISKVNYRPRTSTLVRRTRVTRTATNPRNGNQTKTVTTVKKTNERSEKPRKRKNQ